MDQEDAMQLHPELVTAVLAERERDLARRAEWRRMLPGGERPVRSSSRTAGNKTRRALSALMPRAFTRSDAPR
jgi:hypothetical protein